MTLAGLLSVLVFVAGLGIVALGFMLFRNGRRSSDPTCPKCRYRLDGLAGIDGDDEEARPVTCPECGLATGQRSLLYRRKRRPAWLLLVALGIAVLAEPLHVGTSYRIYDYLSDANIAYLHAHWDEPNARSLVHQRISDPWTWGVMPFNRADTRTLAVGALSRIEKANVRHPGESDRVDPLDLCILRLHDIQSNDAAFSARVARAMPTLFDHPDNDAHLSAAFLACDRHDPASTLPAALASKGSDDPRVRIAAAVCMLEHLRRGHGMASDFVELLEDPHGDVRYQSARLLLVHALHDSLPESLGPALRAWRPRFDDAHRARALALLATLQGDDLHNACRQLLRNGPDALRWEVLRSIALRRGLAEALFTNMPRSSRGGPIPLHLWLDGNRHRSIDGVLEELGFQ